MLEQQFLPNVLEPQFLKEVARANYMRIYKNSEEADLYMNFIESRYYSQTSGLSDKEKTYMSGFIASTYYLADVFNEIEQTKKLKKQEFIKIKNESLKNIESAKQRELRNAKKIAENDLRKNKEIRNNEFGKLEDKESIGKKALKILPVSASSFLIGLGLSNPTTATGVAGVVTFITHTISQIYHSRNRKTKEDVLTDYYHENFMVSYNHREQQQMIERHFEKRKQEVIDDWGTELKGLRIEAEKEKNRYTEIEESKILESYEKHFQIKLNKNRTPGYKELEEELEERGSKSIER